MKRRTPMKTQLAAKIIGENLATWRRLRNITSQELADRVAVSRNTISRLENGDSTVSLATFINVCNVLSITSRIKEATDPFETDFGRIRADQSLPQRIRK